MRSQKPASFFVSPPARTLLIAAAAILFASCKPAVDPAVVTAQDQVKALLRDPASAEFRKVEVYPNDEVCGEVNSKNGFGGYVGFSRFYVGPEGVDLDPVTASDKCVAAIRADTERLEAETRRIKARTDALKRDSG